MSKADDNLKLVQTILGKSPTPTKITEQTTMFRDQDDWEYGGPYYDKFMRRPQQIGYHKPATAQKRIGVQYPNGVIDTYYLTWESDGWYPFGAEVYPEKDGQLLVPVDRCTFTYAEPKFNPCVFTATNDYMQARWGRKLDDSDRRWLARHPLSTDGGVPQEYTATCVDQLVGPYGMRVARMRLRKGSLVLGDSIMSWMISLGVNPMAMADRQTSNAEAAEKMGIPVEQANQLWRVEFADDPLPCSIIGERGWTNQTGVSVGSFGGHARYLAPRSRAGDWFISLQLEPDDKVAYLTPPPNPEYVERKGDPTLIVQSIKRPDSDQQVAIKTATKWHRPGEPPPTSVVVTTPSTTVLGSPPVVVPTFSPDPKHAARNWGDDLPDPVKDRAAFDAEVRKQLESKEAEQAAEDEQVFQCSYCSTWSRESESYARLGICILCAEEAWQRRPCPHCKTDLGLNPPVPLQVTDEYEYSCARCTETIVVPLKAADKHDHELVAFSQEAFAELYYAQGDDGFDRLPEEYGPTDDPPLALGSGHRKDADLDEYHGDFPGFYMMD